MAEDEDNLPELCMVKQFDLSSNPSSSLMFNLSGYTAYDVF
jgi:hypothetical protein